MVSIRIIFRSKERTLSGVNPLPMAGQLGQLYCQESGLVPVHLTTKKHGDLGGALHISVPPSVSPYFLAGIHGGLRKGTLGHFFSQLKATRHTGLTKHKHD